MKITSYKPDDDFYKSGSFVMLRGNSSEPSEKKSDETPENEHTSRPNNRSKKMPKDSERSAEWTQSD